MNVLIIRPGMRPERAQIDNTLHALQDAVGGYIEVVHPNPDDVALIVKEDGKLMGLPFCRAAYDDNGNLVDYYVGNIVVAGTTEDDFRSLTDEEEALYEAYFHDPEIIQSDNHGHLSVIKILEKPLPVS